MIPAAKIKKKEKLKNLPNVEMKLEFRYSTLFRINAMDTKMKVKGATMLLSQKGYPMVAALW